MAKPEARADSIAHRQALTTSLDAFRRVLRALRIAARDTLATAGVSAAQLYVLSALSDGAEASLSELAERTMTDRTSVTAVVDRLVEGALVTKETSGEDRRRAAVRITAKGRTLLRGAPRPPTVQLLDALELLDPAELRRLASGLQALTRAMGIDGERAGMLFEDVAPVEPDRPAKGARGRRKMHA